MEDLERRNHLETLILTPARLRASLRGLPKKVLTFRPAPGKWSILEILCHLRDMEASAYLERYRRILEEENPRLPNLNGDALAIERDYASQDLRDALREWTRLRNESLRLLRRLKREEWARAGTHETAGVLTMEDLLRRHAVGNDAAHLAQIEAIKRRYDVLAKLEAGPGRLAAALRGVSEEALRRRGADGKWSMIENACHLRDIECVYAERFTKIAFAEKPALWMLDNDRTAALRKYDGAEPAAVVKAWKRLREETILLLRALPDAVWRRSGVHPTRGEKTIEELAAVLAGHDESHLSRIEALRAG